jgi:hypothetical protein
MEQQEVNSIMLMVDGVVAMDEDEVDAVLVVAVVFVAMTESKTQSVMKRFQVTWSTGLTHEIYSLLVDLYEHDMTTGLHQLIHIGIRLCRSRSRER